LNKLEHTGAVIWTIRDSAQRVGGHLGQVPRAQRPVGAQRGAGWVSGRSGGQWIDQVGEEMVPSAAAGAVEMTSAVARDMRNASAAALEDGGGVEVTARTGGRRRN
jgi:hypothetical protein